MAPKAVLADHLKACPINEANGTAWYKYMFTQAPAVRAFFKGAENIEPNAVPSDERFQKQGVRFLTKMHEWVEKSDNDADLRKSMQLLAKGHKRFKDLNAETYGALGDLWVGFLEAQTGSMTPAQKAAWTEFNCIMCDEAKKAYA